MALETTKLNVTHRKSGKGHCKSLRKDRQIPAVIYGPKIDNANVSIYENDVVRFSTSKFENAIFELQSDDKNINGIKVIRKRTDIHPVTRRPRHVDLYALDLAQSIQVNVEIKFEGTAQGVRDGGVLNILKHHIEIECPATDIPSFFTVDVTNLTTDHSLHVSDITGIPSNAKLLTPTEEAIVTIATTREEKVVDETAAAEPAATPAAEAEKKK